jgi:hypothetical protein
MTPTLPITLTPPKLYIPPIATMELTTYSNKIVGIQGPPGSGKTVSSLTFPNPVIALFEKPDLKEMVKIEMLVGIKPVLLPFYDIAWLDQHKFPKFDAGVDGYKMTHSPAHAYHRWLITDAQKLSNEQTLITDNWTRLQEHFDRINWSYKTFAKKTGEEDHFEPWDRKIVFSENVSNALIGLSCNIVVLFHEIPERDKQTGQLLDKLQPLQQGKFIAKMKSYYPNFFRQHCRMKRDTTGKETGEREFVWQVQGNSNFDAKCSKVGLPMFVPANYSSIA